MAASLAPVIAAASAMAGARKLESREVFFHCNRVRRAWKVSIRPIISTSTLVIL